MATKRALKENLNEEILQAIREQDILELRSQLDFIHRAMDKANWNPKRAARYEKTV